MYLNPGLLIVLNVFVSCAVLFLYESNFVPAHLTAAAARNLVKHNNRRLYFINAVTLWMKGMPMVLNKRDQPIFEGSTSVNLSVSLFLSNQVYGGSNFLLKIAIVVQRKAYRDKEDNRWIVGGEDSLILFLNRTFWMTSDDPNLPPLIAVKAMLMHVLVKSVARSTVTTPYWSLLGMSSPAFQHVTRISWRVSPLPLS